MFDGLSDDEALAAAIASGLLGWTAEGVETLAGRGLVNRVFVVRAAGRKVVVRMSDRAGAAEEYAKETWCIGRAAERGVSVPAVLGRGTRGRHAYMVESFAEGREGRESPAPAADVWRALGGYAKAIHSVALPGFGLTLAEMNAAGGRESWSRYLEYNIGSLNEDDPLLGLCVVTRAQSKRAREVFAGLRGRVFDFGLTHGDLSLKNTVVGAGGLVTLLDWGSAEAAPVPHHELIQLLKTGMTEGEPAGEEFRAFLDGYGLAPAGLERLMPELLALLMLRAFDKLRWALDRGNVPLDGYVGHAREAAARCLLA